MQDIIGSCRTYSPDNKFRFPCPIFGSKVAIVQCLWLRDQWAKGKEQQKRRGCQACLSASKCPIPAVIHELRMRGDDRHYSAIERVGHLSKAVLDRIARIIVPKSVLDRYGDMPPAERNCIMAVQGLSGVKMLATRAKVDFQAEPIGSDAPEAAKISRGTRKKASDTIEAATTGDLTAALNSTINEAAA